MTGSLHQLYAITCVLYLSPVLRVIVQDRDWTAFCLPFKMYPHKSSQFKVRNAFCTFRRRSIRRQDYLPAAAAAPGAIVMMGEAQTPRPKRTTRVRCLTSNETVSYKRTSC